MITEEKTEDNILLNNETADNELIEIYEGVRLHYFIENRFSTNFISVIWTIPAERESATKVALLAECLKLGKDGDRSTLDKKLSQMYGANLDASILQKGGRQLLALSAECVTDKAAGEKLFKHAAELVKTTINEKICNEALIEAKNRLKTSIEQKRDSTAQTAVERLVDVAFAEDAFSVHCDGYIDDLEGIDLNDINEIFFELKLKAPTDIFISGDIDKNVAIKTAKSFVSRREKISPLPVDEQNITAGCAEKSEKRAIGQSRIAAAYKTSLRPYGKDWCTAMILREILCGSGGSILYNTIRQQEGLCYYIGGKIIRFRMVYIIDAGVGKGSEEHSASLIDESIKSVKINDEQLMKAKKAVLRDEYFTDDRRTGKINRAMNDMLLGITDKASIENDINSVTLSDVQEALSGLIRKGVFILYAEKEED
ncbi:hypothetical protein SDC9_72955 [bioreactor metagenome]|uniref:Peptidase M16 C-terminal domain-containing protein n=1 Tax=bioreactor metagenome TaxID=1076179 RepID=A0A644YIY7_9ZZZZ|nr:hypothetical protein [Candidatus Metalachnospira sp.]